MSSRSLQPFETPLVGMNLIEASAGTGKTWAISALYLRLILESDLRVPNILVVTYTRAATGELKERLRDAIVRAIAAFTKGDAGNDTLVTPLLGRISDSGLAVRKLRRALADFDQAAVFTIHGFCERVLSDSAFQSAVSFDTEVIADEQSLLGEVIDDLWRRDIYPADPYWVDWLAEYRGLKTSDDLLRILRPLISKPYLRAAGPIASHDLSSSQKALEQAFLSARAVWPAERDAICRILLDEAGGLKRNRYPVASMPKWIAALDMLFTGSRLDFAQWKTADWLEKLGTRFLSTADAVRKNSTVPSSPFFDHVDQVLDAWNAYASVAQQHFMSWIESLRARVEPDLRERKKQRQVQGYDDLLLNLRDALLADSDQRLHQRLRLIYQAALLDEFQDTDPIQYEIFRTIYQSQGQPVFMVGDPKQAIYSFRGADIFAYLGAREDAPQRHTLQTNYRATEGLVRAVNSLFTFTDALGSFVFQAIPFEAAVSAATAPEVKGDPALSPLVIWPIQRSEGQRYLPKQAARVQISEGVATEIGRLLDQGVCLAESPIRPQDIAVLVRSHHEGVLIQSALRQAGIPSVRQGQQSIYETHEAIELERVMQAIARPRRESLVRAALLTELMGFDITTLQALEADPLKWDQCLSDFHEWHRRWQEDGFMRMFRDFVSAQRVLQRLGGMPQRERRLTNLLHLAECIQVASEAHPEMIALINWLSASRMNPPSAEEDSLLRLESDEDRVRIVTVHASKGLQYPIVFLPFAWDGTLKEDRGAGVFFHDPANDGQATVDFGSEHLGINRARSEVEQLAENIRLLYVALTRAQSRCYLSWGAVNGAATSPLAWLLHRDADDREPVSVDPLEQTFANLSDEDIGKTLARLVKKAGGQISVAPLPDPVHRTPRDQPETPHAAQAREASRELTRSWQLNSFSALTTGHESALPDHDRQRGTDAPVAAQDFFAFPKGARAGTCLHRIFELIDFTDAASESRTDIIRRVLTEFGFDPVWTPIVSDALTQILVSPLDQSGLSLGALSRSQRIDEMAFSYPVSSFDQSAWQQVLDRHHAISHPALASAPTDDLFMARKGFMQGFIDLVFEHGGRFYLVDYKSNYLGSRFDDYGPDSLNGAMCQSRYTLQYLIYTIALHRWLGSRIPDYDYEQHFGGVFYLFLRGIHPAKPGSGVYFDRPSVSVIQDLDRLVGAPT